MHADLSRGLIRVRRGSVICVVLTGLLLQGSIPCSSAAAGRGSDEHAPRKQCHAKPVRSNEQKLAHSEPRDAAEAVCSLVPPQICMRDQRCLVSLFGMSKIILGIGCMAQENLLNAGVAAKTCQICFHLHACRLEL